jgi:hypothetical protein
MYAQSERIQLFLSSIEMSQGLFSHVVEIMARSSK